ncbi:MAG TPA: winged helix-turn-helix domain-containing protein, partial [Longimicrobiales bacterium]|nr:winged helix-turn-helix domain-containing protein [Longimicrobiales bacterium]
MESDTERRDAGDGGRGRLRFGPYRIDRRAMELRHHGRRVPLEPLPVRILLRLAETPGELVPRDELEALGWSDTPWNATSSLNTCVYQIRRALDGADPDAAEIQTLRGRGYRLVVHRERGALVPRVARAARTRPALAVAVLVGLALTTLVAGTWAVRSGGSAGAAPASESATVPPDASSSAGRLLERARYLARETGDLAAARAVLDSARTRFPHDPAAHGEWAELTALQGDFDAAGETADRALELAPLQPAALRARGMLAMVRGDWGEAGDVLERARAAAPADAGNLTMLAYLRTVEGRFAEAGALVRHALEADPLSATIHRDAGMMFLLMGRYADAETACRDVLRFRPGSRWATDCLFDVMVLTSRPARAAEWGRRLLALHDADVPPASTPAE